MARERPASRSPPDPRRCFGQRVRLARGARDPGRQRLAERLLLRNAHGRRGAGRRLPGRATCAGRSSSADDPCALHHHVERLQRLGRTEPLHRRHQGLVRAPAGARLPRQAASRCAGRCSPSPTERRSGTSSGRNRWGCPCGAGARAGPRGSATSSAGPSRAATRSMSRPPRTSSSIPRCSTATGCYLSVGHDEYWSWGMRDALDAFTDAGGNAAILSGNTCFWQVRFDDDASRDDLLQVPGRRGPGRRHPRRAPPHRRVERPAHRVAGDAHDRPHVHPRRLLALRPRRAPRVAAPTRCGGPSTGRSRAPICATATSSAAPTRSSAYEVDGVRAHDRSRRPARPDRSRRRARRARDPGHRPGAAVVAGRAAEPVRARAGRAREHRDGRVRRRAGATRYTG